jgi:hypothetical protein
MGALIETVRISILVYADDIMLISPLNIGMTKMIIETQKYMQNGR